MVNKVINWSGYSLDEQHNVTVTGNTTITGLSGGLHNIRVYANDTVGNMGASDTAAFSIEPFPLTTTVAVAVILAAMLGVAGFIVYKKRRSRQNTS